MNPLHALRNFIGQKCNYNVFHNPTLKNYSMSDYEILNDIRDDIDLLIINWVSSTSVNDFHKLSASWPTTTTIDVKLLIANLIKISSLIRPSLKLTLLPFCLRMKYFYFSSNAGLNGIQTRENFHPLRIQLVEMQILVDCVLRKSSFRKTNLRTQHKMQIVVFACLFVSCEKKGRMHLFDSLKQFDSSFALPHANSSALMHVTCCIFLDGLLHVLKQRRFNTKSILISRLPVNFRTFQHWHSLGLWPISNRNHWVPIIIFWHMKRFIYQNNLEIGSNALDALDRRLKWTKHGNMALLASVPLFFLVHISLDRYQISP